MKISLALLGGAAFFALALSASGVQAQDAPAPEKKDEAKPVKIIPGTPAQPGTPREAKKGEEPSGATEKKNSVPATKMKNPDEERNKPVAGSTITLAGTVVDSEGNAVEGVEISPYFNAYTGERKASLKATTDAEGKFSLDMRDLKRREVLYASNHNGLGRAVFAPLGSQSDMKIVLQKERSCWVSIKHFGEDTLPSSATVMVMPVDEKGFRAPNQVLFYGSKMPAIALDLAPGTYDLHCRVNNRAPKVHRATVTAGEGIQDLGTIELEQTIIQKHMNKAAPALSATAVRKLGTDIKEGTMLSLDDYKGKWVIVEFWGFW